MEPGPCHTTHHTHPSPQPAISWKRNGSSPDHRVRVALTHALLSVAAGMLGDGVQQTIVGEREQDTP
jgi:hypothetical protein